MKKPASVRFTLNQASPTKEPQMLLKSFAFNINKAKSVRTETLEGKTYMVVPMVMINEGVLHGSEEPLYYPASELSKVPESWDHKPIVVNHPSIDGKAVSACTKDAIENFKIGIIMNTKFEDNKLKAEAWIEESKAKKIDSRVVETVTNGTMMEVSTGLFLEVDDVTGEFNGRKYSGIARNYRPDHLAVLPDTVGACSIADGAGLVRNSKNGKNLSEDQSKGLAIVVDTLVKNALSMSAIQQQAMALVKTQCCPENDKECWYPWPEDVFVDSIIYSARGSQFYQVSYKIENDVLTLTSEPVEVVRVVTYKPKEQSVSPNMKKKLIDKLLGNSQSGLTKDHTTFLEGLPEATLEKMVANLGDSPESSQTKSQAPVLNEQDKKDLEFGRKIRQDARDKDISKILANKANKLSKDQLSALQDDVLSGMASLVSNETAHADNNDEGQHDFSGQGSAKKVENAGNESDVLPLPRWTPKD